MHPILYEHARAYICEQVSKLSQDRVLEFKNRFAGGYNSLYMTEIIDCIEPHKLMSAMYFVDPELELLREKQIIDSIDCRSTQVYRAEKKSNKS